MISINDKGAKNMAKLDMEKTTFQEVLKTIKELVPEAETYGVNIGIEGVHYFVINTPHKMKRLIDELGSNNVKVIFDPVNYLNINNYKGQDKMIDDMFSLLGDKICVLHAKDFVVENGEIQFAKPTEGMLNYKLIFEKMKEHNLDFFFSVLPFSNVVNIAKVVGLILVKILFSRNSACEYGRFFILHNVEHCINRIV